MSSESAPMSSMNVVVRVDLLLVVREVLADDVDHALLDGHGFDPPGGGGTPPRVPRRSRLRPTPRHL